MVIGSLNSVNFKGYQTPVSQNYSVDIDDMSADKMSTKKKIATVSAAAIGAALAAALGIWAVKRGKKPSATSWVNRLDLSNGNVTTAVQKAKAMDTVAATEATIAKALKDAETHAKRQEMYNKLFGAIKEATPIAA